VAGCLFCSEGKKKKKKKKGCTWVKRTGHQYSARKSKLGSLMEGESLGHLWSSKDLMRNVSREVPQENPLGHCHEKCLPLSRIVFARAKSALLFEERT
jgi:hypothetical protein